MAQQKAVEPASEEVDDLIDELQPGAKLLKGQYTITRYLNSGGFGITYLAKDSLDRDVVIKECFPSSVCRRSKVVVAARSRAHTAELRSIVQLFVKEARSLSKIVHPNIVAVHQVFEDNGTAYMAIDYIDGLDLQQVIDGEGPRLTSKHIVEVTEKLLKAVGFIHDSDMLHRDISPDNVLIDKSGEPILIDFGAAREQASKTNRAMSALRVVKDGYSPQEFYIPGSEQGPWSDLYALGATIYHMICDEAPANGQARLSALAEDNPDPYLPLAGRFQGYPPGFLEAIDKALCTLPKKRVQSAAEWLAMFKEGTVAAPASEDVAAAVHKLVADFDLTSQEQETRLETQGKDESSSSAKQASGRADVAERAASGGKNVVQLAAGIAAALLVVTAGYIMLGEGGGPKAPDPAASIASDGTAKPDVAVDAGATPEPAKPTETSVSVGTVTTDVTASEPEELAEVLTTSDVNPDPATVDTAIVEPTTADPVEPAATDATASEPTTMATDLPGTEPDQASLLDAAPVTAPDPISETIAEPAAEPVAEPAVETASELASEPGEVIPSEEAAAPVAEAATEEAQLTAAPAPSDAIPAANQVAFAAWDVEMPFTTDDRAIGGDEVAVVTRVLPSIELDEVGPWLQQGILIYGVNGVRTTTSDGVVREILNTMQVDPDGKTRIVIDYAGSSLTRTTDLLTVSAVRLITLANGVTLRATVVDGVWKTVVVDVLQPDVTSLQAGDVLFRDKTSSALVDGPESLETILADLVGRGVTSTAFSTVRGTKVIDTSLQLALEGGQ